MLLEQLANEKFAHNVIHVIISTEIDFDRNPLGPNFDHVLRSSSENRFKCEKLLVFCRVISQNNHYSALFLVDLMNPSDEIDTDSPGLTARFYSSPSAKTHIAIEPALTPESASLEGQNGHLEGSSDVNGVHNATECELIQAIDENDISRVRRLLEARGDANVTNQEGVTALIVATIKGQVECMQLLLDAKANVNATSEDGDTALLAAAVLTTLCASISCLTPRQTSTLPMMTATQR